MKFNLSLKYNSVPEWQDKYLNYDGLKKFVYDLERQAIDNGSISGSGNKISSSEDDASTSDRKTRFKNMFKSKKTSEENTYEMDDLESQTLDIRSGSKDPKDVFLTKLYDELHKIEEFFKQQEVKDNEEFKNLTNQDEVKRIYVSDVDHLMSDTKSILSHKSSITQEIIHAANSFNLPITQTNVTTNTHANYDEDDEDDEHDDHSFSENSALLSDGDVKMGSKISIKKWTTELYVNLAQLKSYVELNRMAFSKIVKKFDKSLNFQLRPTLFDNNQFFKDSYTFSFHTMKNLDDKLETLVEIYSTVANKSIDVSRAELRSHLKEHIVWERSTVWKDMIGLESRSNAIKGVAADAGAEQELFQLDYYSWPLPFQIPLGFTTLQNLLIPKFVRSWRTYKLICIIIVTIILLVVPTFNDKAQHRCMALLACVALLWATEAIPLFSTSLLCPLLVVLFKVVKDDDGAVMSAADASTYVLGQMWSSTIMVLLGGFVLAAALSKYNIAKVAASYILSLSGDKPRNILLAIMSVALFLSMWISNVATPVLCYSLMNTVLRQLPHDAPFAKALVLGVALACNIAGMSSPISSPQNVVAMEYLTPYGIGWGQWLGVSIPVSIISLVIVWVLLILTFKINTHKVAKVRPIKEKFTLKQWFIIFVLVLTIVLWCVLTKIDSAFGDAGEIAVIPLVLFFGTGLLTTADINNFPWSIVILAMGSLALGKAVSSSGLLSTIAGALQAKVMNFDIMVILIIFGILILVIGTFVSHTVSAIIIIPLVQEVGEALPDSNAAPILIFGIGLLSSCGMGLASSGFPNVTAISMTDDLGRRYLSVINFITRGVPSSILAYLVVITVGYGIMKATIKS